MTMLKDVGKNLVNVIIVHTACVLVHKILMILSILVLVARILQFIYFACNALCVLSRLNICTKGKVCSVYCVSVVT